MGDPGGDQLRLKDLDSKDITTGGATCVGLPSVVAATIYTALTSLQWDESTYYYHVTKQTHNDKFTVRREAIQTIVISLKSRNHEITLIITKQSTLNYFHGIDSVVIGEGMLMNGPYN